MRYIYLLIFCVILTSCEQADNRGIDHVILSGTIEGIGGDSISLRTDSRYKLYRQPELSRIIPLNTEGIFHDTLELQEGQYELELGGERIKLFLKPGYDLRVNFKGGEVLIEGTGQRENRYLQKRDSLTAEIGGKRYYQYFSTLSEKEFLKYADSMETLHLRLLAEYPQLDERLATAETNWARVIKAHKLMNYSFTRKRHEPGYTPSPQYPDPLKSLPINDDRILDVAFFPAVMMMYTGPKAKEKAMQEWQFVASDEYPVSNETVREEIFFTTAFFTMVETEDLDGLYKKSRKIVKDEVRLGEITDKYLELKGLAKGKTAPDFTLSDMQGNPVSLTDLRGNLVYLDFWGTFCKPCIDEMPAFVKLQEEFEAEKIRFVSIGMSSRKESLQQLIEKNRLGGIHLYDPDKEKEIEKKYAIDAFPRYVLIDKEGKIVDHLAKRPSDPGLPPQLRKLLN